jgi:hypothetical protein
VISPASAYVARCGDTEIGVIRNMFVKSFALGPTQAECHQTRVAIERVAALLAGEVP